MWSGPLVDVMARINRGQLDAWSDRATTVKREPSENKESEVIREETTKPGTLD